MERDGQVDWGRLTQPKFDEIVDTLLIRVHDANVNEVVEAIDGRGGDGGIDVDVTVDGTIVQIYQLKYFPEGFSGGWAKTRKQQIRKSFNAAMEHHPLRWTLVIPRNPTVQERSWVRSLKGDRDVDVTIMGCAKLNAAIAARSDLLHAFTRRPLLDALRASHQLQAGLERPEDLDATLTALQGAVDGRSAFWGVSVTVEHGRIVKTLQAKHPRAHEHEPIALHLTANSNALTDEARANFDAFVGYGGGPGFVLPAEAIVSFRVTGPEWIAREESGGEIEIHRLPPASGSESVVELRVVDEDEVTVRSLRGKAVGNGSGTQGFSLSTNFPGGLNLEFMFARELTDPGEVKIRHALAGHDAIAAQGALDMEQALSGAQTVQLLLDGVKSVTFRCVEGPRPGRDLATELIVSDLALISIRLGVPLVVPGELTLKDRIEIRSCRLLLDGHCVLEPAFGSLGATFNGSPNETTERMLGGETNGVAVDTDLIYEIQGHKLRVPGVRLFHTQVRLAVAPESLEEFRSGNVEDMNVIFEPVDGTPFRTYLPSEITDPSTRLLPVLLGIPDVEEHPAHAKIRGALVPQLGGEPLGNRDAT